ncbi:OpgC domain-containing protein [bacterium]|nr:OpgC domain-containing protein [bacterium]
MKRYIEIDFFRGLLLVIMMINHIGCPDIRQFTYQTFGFISAAEGFIFISGLIAGIVYCKRIKNGQDFFKVKSFLKRILHIFIYYIAMYWIVLVLMFLFPTLTTNWNQYVPLFNLYKFHALVFGPLLLYQPIYLHVLPMFMFFTLITPYVLHLFYKGKASVVIVLSFLIWFFAQFGLSQLLIPRLCGSDKLMLGHFNIFAWQSLYVTGLLAGAYYTRYRDNEKIVNRKIFVSCLVVLLFFFLYKHGILQFKIYFIAYLVHNANLGIFRLINFLTFVYVLFYVNRNSMKLFKNNFFSFLGQHSLQVYSFHILIWFFLQIIKYQIKEYGVLGEYLFTLAAVLILLVPAYFHQYYQRQKGKRVYVESSGS